LPTCCCCVVDESDEFEDRERQSFGGLDVGSQTVSSPNERHGGGSLAVG